MTGFKGQWASPAALASAIAAARTPLLWDRETNPSVQWTARGIPVVYVLEFANGFVKVGQSFDFETRLSSNCSHRNVRGHRMIRFWRVASSDMHGDEKALIGMARGLGGYTEGRSTEWFHGVSYADLIAEATRAFAEQEEAA